jgi:hypothetical protein
VSLDSMILKAVLSLSQEEWTNRPFLWSMACWCKGENDRYLVRGDRYVLYEVEQPHRGMYKGIHIRGGVPLHTLYVYDTNLSNTPLI